MLHQLDLLNVTCSFLTESRNLNYQNEKQSYQICNEPGSRLSNFMNQPIAREEKLKPELKWSGQTWTLHKDSYMWLNQMYKLVIDIKDTLALITNNSKDWCAFIESNMFFFDGITQPKLPKQKTNLS